MLRYTTCGVCLEGSPRCGGASFAGAYRLSYRKAHSCFWFWSLQKSPLIRHLRGNLEQLFGAQSQAVTLEAQCLTFVEKRFFFSGYGFAHFSSSI